MSSGAAKRLADHYSEDGAGTRADLRNTALIALVLPKIKGKTVLDIGCGSGLLLSELVKQRREVFGIEPNHELAILLRRQYPSIRIAEETVENLDRIPGVFNAISLLDVLEHITDDTSVLRIIYQKLAPGGRFVLVVPAHQILYGNRDKAMGHHRRYGKTELLKKVRHAGFEVLEIRHWNAIAFLPYWFSEKIFRRELMVGYRTDANAKGMQKLMRKMIAWWFASIEHFIDFGFGLSIILVASRPRDEHQR